MIIQRSGQEAAVRDLWPNTPCGFEPERLWEIDEAGWKDTALTSARQLCV